ncbi:MAG: GNAT family N-acetyltransferase [Pseudohongiellaceae bacterium]
MNNWLSKTELKGELVTLRPMTLEHRDSMVDAAADGKLWELWYTAVPSEQSIDTYIKTALDDHSKDKSLPFVVIENATGKLIGSSRYLNAESKHRRLEIGNTWYRKSVQRSGINTECKLLLLTHAFESLNAACVEFRTHWHNLPSRNAIARLGAKQDGVLRNHQIDPTGAHRDTVVFSIIEHEWPTVKRSLLYKSGRASQ